MHKKQSLFHIAKRDALPWYKSFAIRGCAIVLALIVCAVVTMLMTGENPVSIYATISRELSAPPGKRGLPSRIWRSCWGSLWQ